MGTAGFVQHHNGAVVPQDTDSVKAAKVQHHAAKNTAYYNAAPKKVVYSNVPAMPLRHYLTKKVQVQTPAHTYAINPFYHVYQPHVYSYGYPTVHHSLGKREAEAEPEADAQFYYNTYPGYTGYPYTTGYTGYPYTTGYTYSPYFNNFFNRRVFKREAEAEAEPEADAQYLSYYNTFSGYTPYTTGFRYPYTPYAQTYSPYNYNLNTFNGFYRY